jgi:hypothetical protein
MRNRYKAVLFAYPHSARRNDIVGVGGFLDWVGGFPDWWEDHWTRVRKGLQGGSEAVGGEAWEGLSVCLKGRTGPQPRTG